MLPRQELLKGIENQQTITRVLDLAEQALKTWELRATDFLSPPELAEVERIFSRLTEVQMLTWGGYPQAERQRCLIGRVELSLTAEQVPVVAVEIAGNFLFDPATHRDFLGAMLNCGVDRSKTGDIIVLGERGAQAIVGSELLEFFSLELKQVRSVPVRVKPIDWLDLKIRPPQTKEMVTTEASLRLDAIASAGFGLSRSKMVDLINAGEVRVNWQETSQPSYNIKTGDLITVRGKGRLQIGEIAITKKERYRIQLTRII